MSNFAINASIEAREARETIYRAKILNHMLVSQLEHNFATFGPAYSEYREAVCSWIVDVCRYLRLDMSTTHAAISYLDRLQPDESFSRLEWQMLAITCVVIAAKYGEREDDVPTLANLEEITQQPIKTSQILNYELWALKRLSWEMDAFTPHSFTTVFTQLGIVFRGDVFAEPSSQSDGGETILRHLIKTMGSLAIETAIEPRLKRLPASQLASALVYMARRQHGVQPWWRPELERLTHTDLSTVTAVVNEMDLYGIGHSSTSNGTEVATAAMSGSTTTVVEGKAEAAESLMVIGEHKKARLTEVSSSVELDVSSEVLGGDVDMTTEEAVSFEQPPKDDVPKSSPTGIAELHSEGMAAMKAAGQCAATAN